MLAAGEVDVMEELCVTTVVTLLFGQKLWLVLLEQGTVWCPLHGAIYFSRAIPHGICAWVRIHSSRLSPLPKRAQTKLQPLPPHLSPAPC